jgi:hypothetical protein
MPKSIHVGYVVDEVALKQVFDRFLWFSSINIITPWSPHSGIIWGSVSQTFGNHGPLHRRLAHTQTTFVKLPTPKNACKWIGETLYWWLKLTQPHFSIYWFKKAVLAQTCMAVFFIHSISDTIFAMFFFWNCLWATPDHLMNQCGPPQFEKHWSGGWTTGPLGLQFRHKLTLSTWTMNDFIAKQPTDVETEEEDDIAFN